VPRSSLSAALTHFPHSQFGSFLSYRTPYFYHIKSQ
jgi:hypothetical protein